MMRAHVPGTPSMYLRYFAVLMINYAGKERRLTCSVRGTGSNFYSAPEENDNATEKLIVREVERSDGWSATRAKLI